MEKRKVIVVVDVDVTRRESVTVEADAHEDGVAVYRSVEEATLAALGEDDGRVSIRSWTELDS